MEAEAEVAAAEAAEGARGEPPSSLTPDHALASAATSTAHGRQTRDVMTELIVGGTAIVLMFTAMTYNQLTRAARRVRDTLDDIAALTHLRHQAADDLAAALQPVTARHHDQLVAVREKQRTALEATDPLSRTHAEQQLDEVLSTLATSAEHEANDRNDVELAQVARQLSHVSAQLHGAIGAVGLHAAAYRRAATSFPGTVIARFVGLSPAELQALQAPRAPGVSEHDMP